MSPRSTTMERIKKLREQLEEAEKKEQERAAARRAKLQATVDALEQSIADDELKRAEAHRKVDEAADDKLTKKQVRLSAALEALAQFNELGNPEQYSSMQLEVVEDATDDAV